MRPIIHATPRVLDTGWVDFSASLPAGLAKSASSGRCNLKRYGDRLLVDMQLTVSAAGINTVMVFLDGWRPDVPILTPFTYWASSSADTPLPSTFARGYIGAGGTSIRTSTLPSPGTVAISLDLLSTEPMPT